jgi:Fuseless
MGAASFWRGAWYVLDDQLFPENASLSAITSLSLGTAGMATSQGIVHKAMSIRGVLKPVARFGALYTIAISCVLVWRGTWVGWDCVYEHFYNKYFHQHKKLSSSDSVMAAPCHQSFLEHSPAGFTITATDPGHLTTSGLASHVVAIVALATCGVFASVLAPPAAVSVIKDLAIQSSRRGGTTTTYFKPKYIKVRDSIDNKAYEYVPHLAGYLRSPNTPPSPLSRGVVSTTARGFRSTTTARRNGLKEFG